MKTMKKTICSLALLTALQANDFNYLETNLKLFTVDVLSNIDKPFVINDKMMKDITVFYKPTQNNYKFLTTVLKANDYDISIKNGIYYINKIDTVEHEEKEKKTKVRYIHLNFLNYKDIDSICKLYKVDYTYLKQANKLAIDSTYEKYTQIKRNIELLDVLPNKMKIKLSIFETNLNDLKEHESLIDLNLNKGQKAVFDIFLGSAINISNKADYDNVNSVIKFLDTNSFTTNLTTTIINLEHNKDFILDSSQNIPYLTTSNQIEDTKTKEVNSFEYKDVGLRLNIKPKILNDLVNLDLDFVYSQLLSNDNNLPITTKKTIKQDITLDKDKRYFLLSGINNNSKIETYKNVPLLSSIPVIGNFFKSKKLDDKTTTTTVLIEIIDFNVLDNFNNKNESLILREFDTCKYLNFCD